MKTARRRWHILLAGLLGPHCIYGCGQRVYARDVELHIEIEHAGDVT